MTEEEARAWIRDHYGVSRETLLARFVETLVAHAGEQNLISAATIDHIWSRHIVDSAQLVPLASDAPDGAWIDIGSGAGLPGIVVAALTVRPVILVEPRARRVSFLREVVADLGLSDRVSVAASRVETFTPSGPAAVISARAVAETSKLLAAARHCADQSTVWLLPKGRNAQSELDATRKAWQGTFHVEQSVTQPDSLILVAREVRKR